MLNKDKLHLKVLDTLNNIRFQVGIKLFTEILLGDETTRITKLNLHKTKGFGCFSNYTLKEINDLLEVMKFNKLIEIQPLASNRFIKVLKITNKGLNELIMPQISLKKGKGLERYFGKIQEITKQDIENFKLLGSFLDGLNNEQKKAVIENSEKILCIAGAGTGKTTALIKRIEYLAKYKTIPHNKVLAITFTRKAKQEMKERLEKLIPHHNIKIETFNSFCEKIIRKHEKEIYGSESKVIDNKIAIRLFKKSLENLNLSVEDAVNTYFSDKKIKLNDNQTLMFSLMNDVFAISDYYKNKWLSFEEITKLLPNLSFDDQKKAKMIYSILREIKILKNKYNLRDYTDQMMLTLEFFKKNKELIPEFKHILIDEYQDINDLQIELIDVLNSKNLFVVGDPRQSIYEWRNAKIEHILNFTQKYNDASVVQLSLNYRSTKSILELANSVIEPLKLSNLKAIKEKDENSITIINHSKEDAENLFLIHSILAQKIPRNQIFILTRTNKQLESIANYLTLHNIKFLKKTSDSETTHSSPKKDQVVLSTVHSIKGLEAELVFVVGANSFNYPCKVSEHPVLELIKAEDDYNKENEELRLFYVAITRAKSRLVISYYGNITKFIPRNYLEQNFPEQLKDKSLNQFFKKDIYSELRNWRRETAKLYGMPAFMVLSNRVLMQIAETKPKDFIELEQIPGIGINKLNKFGEDILEVIKEFC